MMRAGCSLPSSRPWIPAVARCRGNERRLLQWQCKPKSHPSLILLTSPTGQVVVVALLPARISAVRAQQQSPDFFDAGRLSALAQLFTVAPDIADVSQPPCDAAAPRRRCGQVRAAA